MEPQTVGEIIDVLKDSFYFQQLVERMAFSATIGIGLFGVGAFAFAFGSWRFAKFEAEERWIGVVVCALVSFMLFWGWADCIVNVNFPEAAVIHDLFKHAVS
jgi:hypothetical protein